MSLNPQFLFRAFVCDAWAYRELANVNSYQIECDCDDYDVGGTWINPGLAVKRRASLVAVDIYCFNFVGRVNRDRALGRDGSRIKLYVQMGRCGSCGKAHWACGDLADLVRVSEVRHLIVVEKSRLEFEVRSED
jgi:hypothetical protein